LDSPSPFSIFHKKADFVTSVRTVSVPPPKTALPMRPNVMQLSCRSSCTHHHLFDFTAVISNRLPARDLHPLILCGKYQHSRDVPVRNPPKMGGFCVCCLFQHMMAFATLDREPALPFSPRLFQRPSKRDRSI
jgi:hypothetical protein